MTVEELINLLQECDPDSVVVMSNAFRTQISLLDDVVWGHFIEDGANSDFVSDEDVDEDDQINIQDSTPAVCLFSED
jgi:hypothetical protein